MLVYITLILVCMHSIYLTSTVRDTKHFLGQPRGSFYGARIEQGCNIHLKYDNRDLSIFDVSLQILLGFPRNFRELELISKIIDIPCFKKLEAPWCVFRVYQMPRSIPDLFKTIFLYILQLFPASDP